MFASTKSSGAHAVATLRIPTRHLPVTVIGRLEQFPLHLLGDAEDHAVAQFAVLQPLCHAFQKRRAEIRRQRLRQPQQQRQRFVGQGERSHRHSHWSWSRVGAHCRACPTPMRMHGCRRR
jgi:hypothetical protein